MNSWSSKKPSLVTARACVLIFQAFQLFSSSVQFCDRSRLPYPCRPESRKRNTCELASAFCSLCRSILPCRQVRQVTNIYVLSSLPSEANKFAHLRINLDGTSFSSGCWHVTSKREVGRKRKSLKPLRFQAFSWWRLGDSNSRPHACEACALAS